MNRRLYTQYVADFLVEFLYDLDTFVGTRDTTPVQLVILDLIVAISQFDLKEDGHDGI